MLFLVFVAALVWDIFAEEFKNGGCRIPFIGIWKKPSKLAHCSFPSFQHISFRNHQSIECIIVKVNFSLTLSCKSWIIFIVLAPDKMYTQVINIVIYYCHGSMFWCVQKSLCHVRFSSSPQFYQLPLRESQSFLSLPTVAEPAQKKTSPFRLKTAFKIQTIWANIGSDLR